LKGKIGLWDKGAQRNQVSLRRINRRYLKALVKGEGSKGIDFEG